MLDILSHTETEAATISILDLLKRLRKNIVELADGRFTQSPAFSSSKKVDMDKPFLIVPPDCIGTKRAVVVGINYVGTAAPELKACQNDALNFTRYLTKVHGFEEENIALLLDDGKCTNPTKWNIWTALHTMVRGSEAGDVCVFYFAGHGSNQADLGGDESDGRDEYLIPVDWDQRGGGFIVDDDLFEHVIVPLKEGVTFVGFMESCRSGTVLDLPYRFKFHDEDDEDANGHCCMHAD